jgi:hypothetical protein
VKEERWQAVTAQFASLIAREVFPSLLGNWDYEEFLRQGGLERPYERYAKQYQAPPLPPALAAAAARYAREFTDSIRGLDKPGKDTFEPLYADHRLHAAVLTGPCAIYRMFSSWQKYDKTFFEQKSSYFGHWWFREELLKRYLSRCRAIEAERKKNPLLTQMTLADCLRTSLRRGLAVRLDWNKFGAARRLALDPADRVPVIIGVGKPMPFSRQGKNPKSPNEAIVGPSGELPGQQEQIWLPWTPRRDLQLWTPPGGW